MRIRTLAIVLTAATAATAFAASAQESAPPPKPTQDEPAATPATPATPPTETAPAMPASPATPARPAESVASPSSAVAAAAKLTVGATVSEAAGDEIGTIAGVNGGHVTLTIDGGTYTVPAKSLSTASGVVVSSSTKAQIQGGKPK